MTPGTGTRWAVLMACHDRRDTTLASLDHLAACHRPDGVTLDVILVDDGSTDGTAAAVAARHPAVTILPADGTLFWGRAMHRAFAHAMASGYDGYLWLNDDTMLAPDALVLIARTDATVRSTDGAAGIIVGTVIDPESGELTFGGGELTGANRWLTVRLIAPGAAPRRCTMLQGNCLFVPSEIASRVGNIDPVYEHGLGDYDYGLRARALGVQLWVAPGIVGTSRRHRFVDHDRLPLRARLGRFTARQMLPPRSWAHFCRRWSGALWPVVWGWPYAKVIVAPWVRRLLGRTNAQRPVATRDPHA